jgi:S-adenosyl methyltransferase
VPEETEPSAGGAARPIRRLDTSVAHPARVYDYWLGGKDNFAADRETAERILTLMPSTRESARANRLFLAAVVHYVVQAGIRQFLDIGTGLPAASNTHEVAQQAAPEARVVYVDNDPIVLMHAQTLLTSTPAGRCEYLDADLRDPGRILERAAQTLDFSQPVAVMMLGVLHFIADDDHPYAITARLMDAVPSESFLAISHVPSDIQSDALAAAIRGFNANASAGVTPRSRAAVTRFFDGLELVPPGVVPVGQWTPGGPADAFSQDLAFAGWVGLARKP